MPNGKVVTGLAIIQRDGQRHFVVKVNGEVKSWPILRTATPEDAAAVVALALRAADWGDEDTSLAELASA